jgi:hypothetical protein
MLQQFFHIFLISMVCITWGLPVIMLSQSNKNNTAINAKEIIISFFTGLSLISLFAAWICLWLPVTWIAFIVATILPLLFTIVLFKRTNTRLLFNIPVSFAKKKKLILTIFIILSLVLFLVLGSNSPVMTDTDLYHLQIVRWNQEYGTVPGLANLYPRYGFYSNWLSLISLFALPFKNENYLYLNITVSTWFLLFLMQKLSFHLQRYNEYKENKIFSWTYIFIIILMFAEWGLFRINSSSTSYDFIVCCLTLIILLGVTENITSGSLAVSPGLIPLIIIAASVPFFKLSGIAIILTVFVYLLVTRKNKFSYLAFAFLILLYTIPFLYRNYIQTGYPLYPYTIVSWGAPDWQVPLQMTERISRFISLNNKYFNQPIPQAEWTHSSFQWIKSWFTHIPLTDQLIILLTVLGLPVFIFYAKKSFQKNWKALSIYITCCLALLIWFILSPDPRFAYGYLLFTGCFPLSFLAAKVLSPKLISVSLSILGIFIIVYGAGKFTTKNIIAPVNVISPELSSVKINYSNYNIPKKVNETTGIRCYYSPLPCIYEINPYLEQRGDSLKQGFRMRKNIDSVFINNYSY